MERVSQRTPPKRYKLNIMIQSTNDGSAFHNELLKYVRFR